MWNMIEREIKAVGFDQIYSLSNIKRRNELMCVEVS